MRGIVVEEFGGPEVLTYREDLPAPGAAAGSVAIRVDAAGVNFADTHQVENSSYLTAQTLPLVPGSEVVGRTVDGRRVVALLGGGGYAEQASARPLVVFELPDEGDRYPREQARQAHEAIRSRGTVGKLVLDLRPAGV